MKKFLTIFIFLFFVTFNLYAAENYAYVDLIKAMNQSKTGQKMQKEIEDKFNYYKTQVEKIQKQIREIQKQLESPLLSDKAKLEKQAQIRKLERQLQQLTVKAQTDLNKMKAEYEKNLIEKIKAVAKSYGDKHNLNIVFTNGMFGIVLYADKKIDITDKIIKLLDGQRNENK